MSIYVLLDEECLLKNGNDESFLSKISKTRIKDINFKANVGKKQFAIKHT